jgi:hypothetical protein
MSPGGEHLSCTKDGRVERSIGMENQAGIKILGSFRITKSGRDGFEPEISKTRMMYRGHR